MQFKLTLKNNIDTKDLYFDIHDTSIASRWAREIDKNYPFFETTRFSNWPAGGKNDYTFINALNTQISIVNEYKTNTVETEVAYPVDQDNLNYLHTFFEQLRGQELTATDFFNHAPDHVKKAISDFNVIIHEYEHYQFNQTHAGDHPYATVVGTYTNRPRLKLFEDDYNLFTFKWVFGTVYINYCEVGKPILDVFKDKDTQVTNILPLDYYSADFQIKFGPSTLDAVYQQRYQEIHKWIANQNFSFKNLSLGLIPVANLNIIDSGFKNYSEIEIINSISLYQEIKATCIK